MIKDARGVALTVTDAHAMAAYERGLEQFRTYRGDPLASFDAALEADGDFAAAAIAKALALGTLFERRFSEQALAVLMGARIAIERATPRERALAKAAEQVARGDWHMAVETLDRVLLETPRDILALQVAHLVDFCRGDATNLRNRVARVLPHWSASTPGYSFVLGMHAFGLEECNQYAEAEAVGLRALALAPEDCWAVHAVTHVHEMRGQVSEGIAFLEARQADWATPDNGFAFHNWWHLALFHMDRGHYERVLQLYDDALAGGLGMVMSRVDATALLWRLRLEGVSVGARFDTVAQAWADDLEREGGYYAFNDFHAAIAFAATGRDGAIARLRKALDTASWDSRANGDMTRTVGIDACEAVVDHCEGRHARAAERLGRIRDGAFRFGGSHAQRDLLTLTLIESARRSGQKAIARHYANERLVHKPGGAWGRRIAARIDSSLRPPGH